MKGWKRPDRLSLLESGRSWGILIRGGGYTDHGSSYKDEKWGDPSQVENFGKSMVFDPLKKVVHYKADKIGRAVERQNNEKNYISSPLSSGLFYARKDTLLNAYELGHAIIIIIKLQQAMDIHQVVNGDTQCLNDKLVVADSTGFGYAKCGTFFVYCPETYNTGNVSFHFTTDVNGYGSRFILTYEIKDKSASSKYDQ
ncbi:Hypothetical predicted protein [Paramuricea clavata]|uniref:Uncharacterized protein n=1 Tax=Paramuricea clavata TaxID=317549 RepID=A0A6S7IU33_PARCT|nr:Hypothetical predicted protein [Paramuricea clavata]